MFKTIHDCRVELVANTEWSDEQLAEFVKAAVTPSEDYLPCSSARASFGNEDKTGEDPEKDLKLMKYLAKHKHMTPFEYQHATFLIECPLFIRSQIHRHRTFSFNEISRRYTSEQIEFWVPDKWRRQSSSNKQASTDDAVHEEVWVDTDGGRKPLLLKVIPQDDYEAQVDYCLQVYNHMISLGVCREQARAVLPQSLITRFYMGGNLRNWAHFIELRKDEHAQYEVRVVAERVEKKLRELWPNSVSALLGEE